MSSCLGTHYLEQYWPACPGDPILWQDNVELLQAYFHCASLIRREAGGRLDALDIGTGPSLAPLLASISCIQHVQLSDFAESSREFLASSPVAHWAEYARELVRLFPNEGLNEEELLAELDQKRRERPPLDCDLRRTPVFLPDDVRPGSWPLVTMHFVADSISRTESECIDLMRRALDFVRPGGFALLSCLIDSTWWLLGDEKEPSPKLSETSVESALRTLGFTLLERVRSTNKGIALYDGSWNVYLCRRPASD
ncbi:MAG: hypothetical protein KIS66_06300 [Fimbriimonadaceae bacterium]|nr:hypothetical protein [Fimbriimonadaceae bacterium]